MTAGLLAAQPGGWIGAPSGDGGAAVPDAWPPPGDAAFAGLLPGYAFAQSVALNLTAAGSITDTATLELAGATGIATFESGGSTYAAVAAYLDNGVQILDVTDPSAVTAAGGITDTATLELAGATGIAIFESGGRTYAAVASYVDDGVQILDVTDPSAVTAAGGITDTAALVLDGASGIAIFNSGGGTYAAVAAYDDSGVQILDVTDPSNVTAAGGITDTATLELAGAEGIAVFESGGGTYAAVAAYDDSGVQILDVTDPSNVTAAGGIADTATLELAGAEGIAIFNSGGGTYAAVTAYDDDGVQILDVTDPSAVTAAGGINDTETLELYGARGISVFESGGSTYAAVASYLDNGVQILDVTDPSAITAAGGITNTATLELNNAEGIATFTSGGSTYAAVASYFDSGIQILRLTNSPPEVGAGADQEVAEGATVTLSGTATDADPGDTLTYSWTHDGSLAITFADPAALSTTFVAPDVAADTTVTVTLTVNDGTVDVTDTLRVTITDSPSANPIAAGSITDAATLELGGATGITTFESGGGTYAAVAAYDDRGVQILDVTDPSAITAAGSITDTTALVLYGAAGIAIFNSGGGTYAAVASSVDDGVQILDVTDPSAVTAAGGITDTATLKLDGAEDIAIFNSGGSTYAAVTAYDDDGIQILDVTDPSAVTAAGGITDTATLELDGASGITIFESGGSTYAAVASYLDNGVQILDVTDPYAVTAAGSINDTAALKLGGALNIAIFESDGGSTYAAVAAYDDDGVQILDVTDPYAVTTAGSIGDTAARELDGAADIAVFESGGGTYAAVAAYDDRGVQILDVTDPSAITAAGSIADAAALELDGARGITIFESGGSTYAAVAAYDDDGVQILRLTNSPPEVGAGIDQEVAEGATVALSGSATDADPEDTLTYGWTHDGSLAITFADPAALSTSFTAPDVAADTTITVTLTVNDGTVDATDTLRVTVTDSSSIPPAADARLNLAAAGSINDAALELDGAWDIATFESGGSTYAAVTSYFDDGVQILDVTDPSAVTAAGSITDRDALELDGAEGIAIFESGGSTYAAVAARFDDGVQILNVTDPYAITAAGSITDRDALVLDGARGIAVFESGGSTYAAVAASNDHGVQILNVTDPSAITAAGSIADTATLELFSAEGIAVFESGGSTYAAVAARFDDGVQILNVTDPYAITAAGSITDRDALELDGARSIAIFESGGGTYAAVAAPDDDGVQILNVTDPYAVTAAGSIGDTAARELLGAWDIAVFESGGGTYAAVTASEDGGVQILDVTDPSAIAAAGSIGDTAARELLGARGITVFESGGGTYAAVTASEDDGVQILDVTDPSAVTAADSIGDTAALELAGASNITVFESGGRTYAAVTAQYDDGVQILDVTDPYAVTAAGSITDALLLDSVLGITTFESGGRTYAAVAAQFDGGVQILDITDPYAVTAAGNITDTAALKLYGASGITVFESGGRTYAAVTSSDEGVQILDVTNPSNVTAAGGIGDTATLELDGAAGIAIFNSGGSTYAAVASYFDSGVQILDITDPYAITAAGSITGTAALELYGATGITVFESGGGTYAAVAAYDDDGVQILDITDPYAVTAAGSIGDTAARELDGARDITVFESGGGTYAAVTAYDDDGIQILDVTDPSAVTAAGSIRDTAARELDGAWGIATFESGGGTYAAVTAELDGGVQILRLAGGSPPVTPNSPPTVNAGQDQEVAEGATVTLSGTATDADPGDTLTYGWTHDGSLAITITGSDSLSASFTAPDVAADTTITVTLTVNDGTVRVFDALQVTITDSPSIPPAADAGLNLTAAGSITDGGTLKLDGAEGITTFESGGSTYAAVAAYDDDGVQILNITDPSAITAAGSIGDTAARELAGATGITVFESGGGTYAAVAAYFDDGVQILNVTDPSAVTAAGSIGDTAARELDGASGIAVFESGGSTYAAVTASEDGGVQILDVTDPSAITAAGSIGDTAARELDGASGIAVFESGGSTYAAVASFNDDGVQILNVTDPSAITAAGSIGDTAARELDGASGIAVFESGGSTYAAVASFNDDGVQILDVTDPSAVTAAGSIANNSTLKLDGAWDIATFESGGSTYAAVASVDDDGVQILDVTDPSAVTAAGSIANNSTLKLDGARSIAIFESGGGTYAAVAAPDDDGVQILRLAGGSPPVTPNSPPAVEAGDDQTVAEGATVTLTGTATDADPGDTLTYGWTHDGSLAITFADPAAPSTTFAAPDVAADTTVTVTLTVNDGTVGVTDTLQVTVTDSPNSPPTVNAGQDQEVAEGATVTLTGTATDADPEDTLTYSWTHDGSLAITFADPAAPSTTFAAPDVAADTTITVTLTVNDGTVGVSDALQVTVTDSPNSPPVVEAGDDQEVAEGATVTLTGTATDADPEDTLTYSWTHDGSLAITFADPAAPSTTFAAPDVAADTTVTVTLTVNDGTVGVSDALQVTVTDSPNSPPTVNAGQDQEVAEGATVTLTGTATDADPGDTLTYSWTHDGSLAITFADPAAPSTTFAAPDVAADTTVTVTLTVNDGTVGVSDALQVTVTDSPNSPPVVEAGDDQEVAEGATVTLTGTATDADPEDTLTYSWTHDGSLAITFADPAAPSTTFAAPDVAADTTITVTLTVNDGTVGVSDALQVTVTDSPNSPPVVEAGDDQEVAEGATVTLTGTATDADPEDTLTYSWTHDGSLAITFADPAAPSTTFAAPDVAADTTVTVTLTVNDGTVGVSDALQVTVTDSPNSPPTVNAGQDQEVAEGATVTLTGTATDADPGDTLTYSWTHDGSLAITFADPAAPSTTFAAPDVAADTTITVTLTVNDGTVGVTDTLQVTVTDSPSANPIAAGSITDTAARELDGATGIATFESGGSTYAAVAAQFDGGVQILDVTDPSNVTAAGGIGDTAARELAGATGIAIFNSGGSTYAAVAAYDDDGVQILDVTDPSNVTAAGSITDTAILELDGAAGIAVFESGGSTYAAVAAQFDGGVQILDVTDPSNVTAAGGITDTATLELAGAAGIAIFNSGGSTYAAVAAQFDGGVQILDVTDPSNVTAAGGIGDTAARELAGAAGIAVFESGGGTYAAVAAQFDGGVQILDVTDPSNVTAAGGIGDTAARELAGATGIATFESGDSTYAAVAAPDDDGVQILDVTDPSNVTAAGGITDTAALELAGARGIATFESGGSTYAAVAAYDDGVQILRLTDPPTAANSLPTVDAGGDRRVSEGEPVSLSWSASDDDGDPLTYTWSQSPAVPAITFASPGSSPTTFTAPQVNSNTLFTLTLTANDGTGDGADSLRLTVRDSGSGGGGSARSQAPALDLGTLRSSGLVSIPQDVAQLLREFDRDEPIPPVNATGPLDAPLVINGSAYMLGGIFNTLEPQALRAGEPMSVIFTVYSRADIVHFTVYMNLQGADPRLSGSDTHIRFDRGAVSTADPDGFIAGANVTITQDPDTAHKHRVQVDVEFAKGMEQTSMIIGMRSARSAPTAVYAINAFEVLPSAAAQAAPDAPAPGPDAPPGQEPPVSPAAALRMWAGSGPATIGDAGLLAALGLDYPDAAIPAWVKTGLAPLVVNGYATTETFTAALEYVLGAIRDGGTRDAAGSRPADADPGRTHTVAADTTAPTVTSIERSDPAGESTSETTLVFGVTFSEGVTGVDAGDFALSTGGASGQFTQTSTPGLAIPDNAAAVSNAITVPGPGTAASVSVAVDIEHPYIGDLTVELVAPDGAARTLHGRSGGNADGIFQTYAPDFGGAGIAGDWTLRASDGAPGDAGTLDGWTLTIGHGGAGGSVTGLAGSGSQYLVTVSAPQGGTYSLGVVQDSGIADAAGNPLSGTDPTGADHTYTVIADTTAPTVASIERSDPASQTTSAQTMVFAVTFSEDVTGVDAGDFALSTGGASGQFTRTSTPGLAIPDNAAAVSDAITVPGPGTAASVSVAVDIEHPYIGDLTVELVAPDGAARILHDRSGGNADGIARTYAPDFGGAGIAGDWTLRASDGAPGDAGTLDGWTLTIGHGGADSPVTGLAGSGSRYLVTVSAPQGGTYSLGVVQDSGIADAAGNPLSGTDPTGADHTYTVIADTTAPTVASIERSDPAEESTSGQTLVFAVTFSEDVTGVDAGDFELSTGGASGQFTQTSTPGLAIPDNAAAVSDAIAVPGPGTATSVSVSVDIAHPYIDDLTVELVAPDGAARILHGRSGGNADGIARTYAPDFGGTGIAGDWTLRVGDGAPGDAGTLDGWTLTIGHGGADSLVTGLTGSGSRYLVTVSAPQGGTYGLGVVQDSGIADAAGNPLAGAAGAVPYNGG